MPEEETSFGGNMSFRYIGYEQCVHVRNADMYAVRQCTYHRLVTFLTIIVRKTLGIFRTKILLGRFLKLKAVKGGHRHGVLNNNSGS